MNATDLSTLSDTLTLQVIGNVPGKKNSKIMVPRKGNQRPLLITKPEIKKFEQKLVESFRLQLISAIPTAAGATSRIPLKQFWMRLLPQDDCWTQIPVVILTGQLCKPGEEGATVTIKRI